MLLACRIGMPISTKHSLVGTLIGAGWPAGSATNLQNLGSGFVVPLLVRPVLSLWSCGHPVSSPNVRMQMNHGQGFTGNFITSLVVIGASRLGLPVSTTHVSCGALFGIVAVTRQANWGMLQKILGAWLVTLPTGAAFGAVCYWGIHAL